MLHVPIMVAVPWTCQSANKLTRTLFMINESGQTADQVGRVGLFVCFGVSASLKAENNIRIM